MLGLAPSPEQPWHSSTAVPPARGSPAAGVPRKRDPSVELVALAGPDPAQPWVAPHSPICSSWTTDTS